MDASRDVAGRVVVITGASRGIGRELAIQLLSRGARVIAISRRAVEGEALAALQKAAVGGCGSVDTLPCDVSSVTDVRSLFADKLPSLGITKIDVLVNNAGIMPCIFADPVTTSDELEEQTMRVNSGGAHFVTKFALPYMLRTPDEIAQDPFERSVLFMGSAAAYMTEPEPGNGMLAYHASKAAVNGTMVALHETFDAPLRPNSMTAVVRAGRSLGRIASADPGFVATQLGSETLPPDAPTAEAYALQKPGFGAVSIEAGTDTILWLVLAKSGVVGGKTYYKREAHAF